MQQLTGPPRSLSTHTHTHTHTDDASSPPPPRVFVAADVTHNDGVAAGVAVVKRQPGPLVPTRSVLKQVQIVTLGSGADEGSLGADADDGGDGGDGSALAAGAGAGAGAAADPDADGDGAEGGDSTSASGSSVFEVMHTYLHFAFSPLLASYGDRHTNKSADDGGAADATAGASSSRDDDDNGGGVGIPAAKARITELEGRARRRCGLGGLSTFFVSPTRSPCASLSAALLRCQQHQEIPEVHLVADPELRPAVSACQAASKLLPVEALKLESRVADTHFLNRLQRGMIKWTQDIQRVTHLSRDPAAGSAEDRLTFWRCVCVSLSIPLLPFFPCFSWS